MRPPLKRTAVLKLLRNLVLPLMCQFLKDKDIKSLWRVGSCRVSVDSRQIYAKICNTICVYPNMH